MRVLLFAILLIFMLSYFEGCEKVERVIDGDTIVVSGRTIRLFGIDAPEKGERMYEEAKSVLLGLVGECVKKKCFGYDGYGRELCLIYVKNKNINLLLLSKGLSRSTLLPWDPYYTSFSATESMAMMKRKGIWSTDLCNHSSYIRK